MFLSLRNYSGHQTASGTNGGEKEGTFLFPVCHANENSRFFRILSYLEIDFPTVGSGYSQKRPGKVTGFIRTLEKRGSFRHRFTFRGDDGDVCPKGKEHPSPAQGNFPAAHNHSFFPLQVKKQGKTVC